MHALFVHRHLTLKNMLYRQATVIGAAFFAAATYWMFLPLLSVSLRHDGVSDVWVGIISSLPWVGLLVVSGFIPGIIRRLGLKRMILIGMGLSVLAFLGFAITRNIWVWALLCLLIGAAFGLRWAGMDTWMNGSFPEHLRGRLTGLYELIISGSIAFGPAILVFFGNSGSWSFLAAALIMLSAALIIALTGKEAAHATQKGTLPGRRLDILWQDPAPLAGVFMVGMTEAGNLSMLPIFGLANGFSVHLSALLVVVVQAGVAAGALLIGGLADHLNRTMLRNVSACAMVLMPVGLVFSFHPLLWPWLAIWGIVQGGLFTLGIITLASRHSGLGLANAMTLSMVIYTVGGIISPSLLGLLTSLLGRYGFVLGLTIMALAGALFMMRARRYESD